jgi:hypothetical protein
MVHRPQAPARARRCDGRRASRHERQHFGVTGRQESRFIHSGAACLICGRQQRRWVNAQGATPTLEGGEVRDKKQDHQHRIHREKGTQAFEENAPVRVGVEIAQPQPLELGADEQLELGFEHDGDGDPHRQCDGEIVSKGRLVIAALDPGFSMSPCVDASVHAVASPPWSLSLDAVQRDAPVVADR